MAKLSAHGTELVRYFSPRKRALVSVRSDGITLHRTPYSDWKIYSHKKSEVTLENWKHGKYTIFDELPRWAARCKSLPSVKQIEHWNIDAVGYVTSVVPLDCWIQITTEAKTPTRRHRAVILIGNTNYKIMPGDVVWWGVGRDLFWAPAGVTLPELIEGRKKGFERKLSLNRVLTQETEYFNK